MSVMLIVCLSELCIASPKGSFDARTPGNISPHCFLWKDNIAEMKFSHKMFSKNKNKDNIQR